MKKGNLEKRILLLFFIVTFVMVFILVMLSWQIIRFSISQRENEEINAKLSQVIDGIEEYSENRKVVLKETANSARLINALKNNNIAFISNYLRQPSLGNRKGIFYLYNSTKELVYGERFSVVEDNISHILSEGKLRYDTFYPVAAGNDIYALFVDALASPAESENKPLGYLFYLTPLDRASLNISSLPESVLLTVSETMEIQTLPERYKPHKNHLKNSIQSAADKQSRSQIISFNLEFGGGLLLYYDIFAKPVLAVFTPYQRDFNQFAHKGLLVFFLTLLGFALLMITITGTWFKGRIIAPLRDVGYKMKQIEKNPNVIEPMEKKFGGILGEMIDTFNLMNASLVKHSQSLLVFKTITDNLDSGILWMDKDFDIILCNPSVVRLFNYHSSKEIIGKNLKKLIKIEDKMLGKAKTGIFIPRFEITTCNGSKFVKFVLFSVKQVNDESGLRHIASIYDITKETKETRARERLEMELIKSNRLAELGRLAEGILHNLNSPLNSITGYSQLLKKSYPDNPDIDRMMNAGRNIAHNIKKLLSKAKEDGISMLRPLDINELLSLELDMCRHNIFFFQNVTLQKRFGKLHRKVYAAHGDISICVTNIINNAIHAMKSSQDKILTVETAEDHEWTAIKIKDTGFGIAPEDIPHIFSPEFTTKAEDPDEGYGLGLAISKSIVEKYKGKIKVKSAPGKGSTFIIYLPNSGAMIDG